MLVRRVFGESELLVKGRVVCENYADFAVVGILVVHQQRSSSCCRQATKRYLNIFSTRLIFFVHRTTSCECG